jgi:hypothetical protein
MVIYQLSFYGSQPKGEPCPSRSAIEKIVLEDKKDIFVKFLNDLSLVPFSLNPTNKHLCPWSDHRTFYATKEQAHQALRKFLKLRDRSTNPHPTKETKADEIDNSGARKWERSPNDDCWVDVEDEDEKNDFELWKENRANA